MLYNREGKYLFIDMLPTILALDGMLDDRILGETLIQRGETIEGEAHADKIDQPVEEEPIISSAIGFIS